MQDVGRWWAALSASDKDSLRMKRPRLLARFVEVDPRDEDTDLYEWIVGHELTYIQPRTFHICTRHRFTELAPEFTCPFAESSCPMRVMLDASPGRSIRFR